MYDIKNEIIDNKLYEYRVLAHLTQGDLAKQVHVSKQTIFSIETKKHIPTLKIAFRLANFFNVSITSIFSYKVKK